MPDRCQLLFYGCDAFVAERLKVDHGVDACPKGVATVGRERVRVDYSQRVAATIRFPGRPGEGGGTGFGSVDANGKYVMFFHSLSITEPSG